MVQLVLPGIEPRTPRTPIPLTTHAKPRLYLWCCTMHMQQFRMCRSWVDDVGGPIFAFPIVVCCGLYWCSCFCFVCVFVCFFVTSPLPIMTFDCLHLYVIYYYCCVLFSKQNLFSESRVLFHTERWYLHSLPIICWSTRNGEGNSEKVSIQDRHWSGFHSQGMVFAKVEYIRSDVQSLIYSWSQYEFWCFIGMLMKVK